MIYIPRCNIIVRKGRIKTTYGYKRQWIREKRKYVKKKKALPCGSQEIINNR